MVGTQGRRREIVGKRQQDEAVRRGARLKRLIQQQQKRTEAQNHLEPTVRKANAFAS